MKNVKRIDLRQRPYFITVVTFDRIPLLLDDIDMFWQSWADHHLDAWVILPEHFHAVLDVGKQSISQIVHSFKIKYSIRRRFRGATGKVWQNRFWDHIIRDQIDFNHHVNYVHYNPVKHRLVSNPFLYEYSSLNDFHKHGYYDKDWGTKEDSIDCGDFGE